LMISAGGRGRWLLEVFFLGIIFRLEMLGFRL
jgi:hypothetical protein